eukprot:403330862
MESQQFNKDYNQQQDQDYQMSLEQLNLECQQEAALSQMNLDSQRLLSTPHLKAPFSSMRSQSTIDELPQLMMLKRSSNHSLNKYDFNFQGRPTPQYEEEEEMFSENNERIIPFEEEEKSSYSNDLNFTTVAHLNQKSLPLKQDKLQAQIIVGGFSATNVSRLRKKPNRLDSQTTTQTHKSSTKYLPQYSYLSNSEQHIVEEESGYSGSGSSAIDWELMDERIKQYFDDNNIHLCDVKDHHKRQFLKSLSPVFSQDGSDYSPNEGSQKRAVRKESLLLSRRKTILLIKPLSMEIQ